MNNENESIKTLASNLWNNFIKDRVKNMHKDNVRYFRATVVTGASGGTMQVQKPFDSTVMTLPYVTSAGSLTAGSQCVVLVLGDYSNAIVLGDGKLSNL